MPYTSRHAGTLADLMLRQGDLEADKAARAGQMWGNVARGVASIPAGIQQRKAAEAAARDAQIDREIGRANTLSQIQERGAARDERNNARMDEQGAKDLALTTQKVSAWLGDIASAPDPESMKMAYKVGRDALVSEGRLTPQDAPEFFPGVSWVKARAAQLLPAAERFKQMFPEPNLHNVPAGTTVIDQNNPQAGAVFTAPPKEPTKYKVTVPGPNGEPMEKLVTEEDLSSGIVGYRAPVQGPQPSYSWAMDPKTNQPVYATPDEIRTKGYVQAATADMRNKEAGKKTAGIAVKAVRDLGSRIITKVGPAQRADAIQRGAEAVFGNDPEFRTYQDSRMALAGTLAVEQQGSRVSDADVKALWLPMVPDAYRDTAESYRLKWDLIDAMRGAAGSTGAQPKEGDTKPIDGYPGTEQTFRNGKWIRTK